VASKEKAIRKLNKKIKKAISSGKLEKAIEGYKDLLKLTPRNLAVMNQLGDLYVKIEDYANAFKYYQKLAEYYDDSGRTLKGVAIYRKMYRLNPKNTDIAFKLAKLYQKGGIEIEAKKIYIDMAEYLKTQRRTNDVLNVYKKLVELDSGNINARERLAEMYEKQKKHENAAEEFRKIGELYHRKKKKDLSIKYYDKAFKLTPNLLTLKSIIKLHKENKQFEKAIDILKTAIDASPENENFKKELAILYIEMKETEKAEEILIELGKKGKELDIELYRYLARSNVSKKKYKKAFQIIEPIIDKFVKEEKINKALELLNLILSVNSSYLPALWKKADIYNESNKKNSYLLTLTTIAGTYENKKNYEKAKEIYKKLVSLNPSEESHRFELERVKKIIDQKDKPAELSPEEKEKETLIKNLHQFEKMFESGFREEAVKEVEALDKYYPENHEIKELLLDFYLRLNSTHKAVKIGRNLINLYEKLGEKERIASIAEELISYAPNDPVLNNYLNSSETEMGLDSVPQEKQTPFKEKEKTLDEYLSEIDFFIGNNFKGQASQTIDEALKMYPENPELIEKKNQLQKTETQDEFEQEDSTQYDQRKNNKIEEEEEELVIEEESEELEVEIPDEDSEILDEQDMDKFPEEQSDIFDEEIESDISIEEITDSDEDIKEPEKEKPKKKIEEIEELEIEKPKNKIQDEYDSINDDLDFSLLEDKEIKEEVNKLVQEASKKQGNKKREEKEDNLINLEDEVVDEMSDVFDGEEIFNLEDSYYYEVGTIVSQEHDALKEISDKAKTNVTSTMERNLDEILSQFKEKLNGTIEKEDYETRYNLGIAYFGMGLYDEAVNEFLTSSKGSKWEFDSYVHLGLSFYHKGVFSESEKWFEKALNTKGRTLEEYMSVKYELARIYEITGKINEAIKLYREIIMEKPNFRDAKEKLKTLLY